MLTGKNLFENFFHQFKHEYEKEILKIYKFINFKFKNEMNLSNSSFKNKAILKIENINKKKNIKDIFYLNKIKKLFRSRLT
jgi:hypothetical protein